MSKLGNGEWAELLVLRVSGLSLPSFAPKGAWE